MKNDLTPQYVLGMSVFLYFLLAFASGIVGSVIAYYSCNAATAVMGAVIFCNAILIALYHNMLKRSGMSRIDKPQKKDATIVVFCLLATIMFDVSFVGLLTLKSVDISELEYWSNISSNANIVLDCIAMVIFAPVLEELLFRGIIYGCVKHSLGGIWALLISSIVFGIAHGFGLYTILGFIAGLILASAYELSGTLVIPIIIHALNNLLSQIETSALKESLIFNFQSTVMTIVCILISLILSICMIVMLVKKTLQNVEV